jgi:hypothetical protein
MLLLHPCFMLHAAVNCVSMQSIMSHLVQQSAHVAAAETCNNTGKQQKLTLMYNWHSHLHNGPNVLLQHIAAYIRLARICHAMQRVRVIQYIKAPNKHT